MAWSALATLLFLASPRPAGAFTFQLVSPGDGQHLAWMWETYPPYSSCFLPFYHCGDRSSVDGMFDVSQSTSTRTRNGGLLTRFTSSGSLKVVAMPIATYLTANITGETGRVWSSIDAEIQPLVFAVVPEVGDPFPLVADLQILPRIVGTIQQYANIGTQADVRLQLKMAVFVDAMLATRDSLYAFYPSTGQFVTLTPAFPKGPSNFVVVPGVVGGSEVTVLIWAYLNLDMAGYASVQANSDYGFGPAIEILVRSTDVVGVPEEAAPAGLSLAAWPNPAPGETRISYTLPRPAPVRLSVYDLAGARVATLVDRGDGAGPHEITWNGRGASGERLAAGVYVLELMAGSERRVGKLALLSR